MIVPGGDGEPEFSVVIPTFQRREPVLEAFASALAQTFSRAEVIVVDDGSTDGTIDAVTARYGDQVRMLQQPNRGPSAARNAAVEVARGDVIAFLDSDDEWLPRHLAVVAELFARHPSAVLVGTQLNFRFGDESPADALLVDLAEDLIVGRLEIGIPTSVAVRRDAFEAVGGFDERIRYGEDNDLYLQLALRGPFALIAARTVQRRRRSDSLAAEGRVTGGFEGYLELSADRALAALDRCPRADADALRAAAHARRAIGAVATSLAREEPAEAVGRHLHEIRRWMPRLDPEGRGWRPRGTTSVRS
jgi:glycosyltransferase involved in cell wall biosynthesis